MKQVRCAIIGAGSWGTTAHVPALIEHPQAELVAIQHHEPAGPGGGQTDDPLRPHPDREAYPVDLQQWDPLPRFGASLPGRGSCVLQGSDSRREAMRSPLAIENNKSI